MSAQPPVDDRGTVRRTLQTVFDLSDWFAGSADLQQILDETARRVAESMGMKACGIRLLDDAGRALEVKASYNLSDAYLKKGPVVVEENPIDAAALSGEVVFIENAWTDPRVRYPAQAKAEGLISGLCGPMTYRGETVGVIRVYSDVPTRFTSEQEHLLRAAGTQAAAGIIQSRLLEQRHRADRYRRQLQYAGEIQRRMIPSNPPELSWIQFGCVYQPSLEVGGDFFDFIELPRGGLGFSVADVVGKGIPAALMMASVRSALRAHAFDVQDVRTTVARVNRHVCRDTLVSEFATVFYGLFDRKRRRLDYVNAGHDPPLVLRREEVIRLDVGGLVIGILPEAGFDHGRIEFEPGDRVVFYTDGVVDAMNFDGERFGRQRLTEAIIRFRDCAPEMMAKQILWETRRFSGLAEQTDDISIVAAEVR